MRNFFSFLSGVFRSRGGAGEEETVDGEAQELDPEHSTAGVRAPPEPEGKSIFNAPRSETRWGKDSAGNSDGVQGERALAETAEKGSSGNLHAASVNSREDDHFDQISLKIEEESVTLTPGVANKGDAAGKRDLGECSAEVPRKGPSSTKKRGGAISGAPAHGQCLSRSRSEFRPSNLRVDPEVHRDPGRLVSGVSNLTLTRMGLNGWPPRKPNVTLAKGCLKWKGVHQSRNFDPSLPAVPEE